MSDAAALSPTARVTRRELRQAAQHAGSGQLFNHAATRRQPDYTDARVQPEQRARASSAPSWAQILGEQEPAMSRMVADRTLSRRQRRATAIRGRHRLRRGMARSAVLAMLAASTVAAPLIGPFCLSPAAHAHPEEAPQQAPDAGPVAASPAGAASQRPGEAVVDDAPVAPRDGVDQASRSIERQPIGAATEKTDRDTVAEDLQVIPPEQRVTVYAEPAPPPPPAIVLPLAEGAFRVTSSYGARNDPFNGSAAFHEGVDLAAPMDTPIYAVADGVVDYVGAGKDGRSSMIIVIAHEVDGQTFYSWYNHMYADDLYVQEGQEVAAGDVIAGVGSNGRSTGPHLHFEIHTDDELTTTDPLTWLQEQDAVDISALS